MPEAELRSSNPPSAVVTEESDAAVERGDQQVLPLISIEISEQQPPAYHPAQIETRSGVASANFQSPDCEYSRLGR